jgi:menaquinone-dependent protoporphyrinogen oxidase
MTQERILIVYGTKYGQTARIADRIADTLMAEGFEATIVHAHSRSLPGNHNFGEFAGVVVGASVIRGRHQHEIERFVRSNLDSLAKLPSAFFSVSGAAASSKPGDQDRARGFVDLFLSRTGWHPSTTQLFGGAIAYTRYPFLLRWMMKRMTKREGGPTDASRDHDLTNWPHVEQFAREFARRVHHERDTAATAAVPAGVN